MRPDVGAVNVLGYVFVGLLALLVTIFPFCVLIGQLLRVASTSIINSGLLRSVPRSSPSTRTS